MRLLSVQMDRMLILRMRMMTSFREGIKELCLIGRMGSIVEGVLLPRSLSLSLRACIRAYVFR